MNNSTFKIVIIGLFILTLVGFSALNVTPIYFDVPKNWPAPAYNFKNNPLTEEGFQLGRALFYDPILSRDNTISCSSCHLQQTGFTHVDHELSHGIDGQIGTRNSLTLQNLAWAKNFMWDGGVNHLEMQAIGPITSPFEMDESVKNVVSKLQSSNKYQQLFFRAFRTDKITGQMVLKSLSQFVVCLVSSNSRYDQMIRNEIQFTNVEQNGYNLFKKNCASCHQEPLFSNNKFENNGLEVDVALNDFGRMKITQKPDDSLKFKVPTLRNVQFTFPYMHDGRFKTLNEVTKHYSSGIVNSKTLAKPLQNDMHLTDANRVELIAFLKTLTDTAFLFNPKYGYPRDK